jgi:hypothetical protein
VETSTKVGRCYITYNVHIEAIVNLIGEFFRRFDLNDVVDLQNVDFASEGHT